MDRWPRPPQVGYGVPGAVALGSKGQLETARQHSSSGFIATGTKELFTPVVPRFPFGEHPTSRQDSINIFMNSELLGGVEYPLLKALVYESQILTSPSVLDPALGQRVVVDPTEAVFFADDRYLRKVRNESIVRNYDLSSPIMQIEGPLCRTWRGVAYFDRSDNRHIRAPEYIVEGDFMHTSEFAEYNSICTTDRNGMVKLWDVESGEPTWELSIPRGNLMGWSRAMPWGPQTMLWCSIYEMATVDLRVDPRKSSGHRILHFPDKQQEIKAVCDAGDRNLFALTSFHLNWICEEEPVLSLEQPLAATDYSISLAHCLHQPTQGNQDRKHVVTATSQLSPLTVCWLLGNTPDGLPCTLDDPYYMESWPTILPQSHALTQNSGVNSNGGTDDDADGMKLYSVGSDGGLFVQSWQAVGEEVATDEVIDVPPPDPVVKPLGMPAGQASQTTKLADFDLIRTEVPGDFYNFSAYYRYAFADPPPNEPDASNQKKPGEFEYIGFKNKQEFQKYCVEMWVDPLEHKNATQDAFGHRQQWVDSVVDDIVDATAGFGWEPHNLCNRELLNRDVQHVVGQWQTEEEEMEQEMELQSQTQSQTQTQSQILTGSQILTQSQTQPFSQSFSQSQPVLGPVLKKKKIKKRKRH